MTIFPVTLCAAVSPAACVMSTAPVVVFTDVSPLIPVTVTSPVMTAPVAWCPPAQ